MRPASPPRVALASTLLLLAPLALVASGQGCADEPEDLADADAGAGGDLRGDAELPGAQASAAPTRFAGLDPIGVYRDHSGQSDTAEILSFDAAHSRLFVTNPRARVLEVLDLGDPRAPTLVDRVELDAGLSPTSVDVFDGIVALALASERVEEPGRVLFFDAGDLRELNRLELPPLPDMLAFSPDGARLLVACEGEPAADDRVDPEGWVAVIDLDRGVETLDTRDLRLAGFEALVADLDPEIRIDPRAASALVDLEPEFLTISADASTAWVSLQENNAVARVDLETAEVRELWPLGVAPNPRVTATPAFANLPVFGLRQPDALARFAVDGHEFLITANEGDCRRSPARDEHGLLRDLPLDPEAFPDAAALARDEQLGRLAVTTRAGDRDGDGDYDELYTCGSRSVSVWTDAGELLWDSGPLLEQLSAAGLRDQAYDEGPGPEGVVTAELWGHPYAFVGLERAGGVVVFELSEPEQPRFLLYANDTPDLGPEGLEFVPAEHSPNGEALLITANEISGTVRVYEILGRGELEMK